MNLLTLSKSKLTAILDDEDFKRANIHKWYFDGRYVVRTDRTWFVYKKGQPAWQFTLHSFIMGPSDRKNQIDHLNLDRLDYRRGNLRWSTSRGNNRNQLRINQWGVKGVHWDKRKRRWAVRIRTDNGRIRLGTYKEKEAAVRVYDEAAIKYHGEFARTNGAL